ncbi:MAG: hypothetical protein ACT4P7_11085 [Gemmatimonadaceae bacterium]
MFTQPIRTLVSLIATTTVALAPGACARAPFGSSLDRPTPASRVIRFDNESGERVHVYLIGEQSQWLLGRVDPGAIATLRIPEASLARNMGFVRLAVLADQRITLQAADDPHASSTIAQPMSAILSHQWRFAQGQVAPRLGGRRREVRRE